MKNSCVISKTHGWTIITNKTRIRLASDIIDALDQILTLSENATNIMQNKERIQQQYVPFSTMKKHVIRV